MNSKIIFICLFPVIFMGRLLGQTSGIHSNESTRVPTINFPVPNKNFDGVNDITNAQPPDTHGSVGPNHVMSVTNLGFKIDDKNGNTVSGPTTDVAFFLPLKSKGFPKRDGRLVYDPFGQRWIFIVLYSPSKNVNPKGFFIAISTTSDPTGAWNMWAVHTPAIDYPTLGFNENWICVGNNVSAQLYVFDKSFMYTHDSQSIPEYKTFNGVSGIWQPCVTLDSAEDNLYLVESADNKKGKIALAKISGTGDVPVYSVFPTIVTGYTWNSPAIIKYPQSGTDSTLTCGGKDGMMNALFINHHLWCTQAIGFFNPNHTGFQWWEIDPEESSVLQFKRIQDSTAVYYYCAPSIAVDYQDNVLVGFSVFSKTSHISSGYVTHFASENANTRDSVYIYNNGDTIYTKRGKWGDFSNSCIDPIDHSLWTVQAYADNKGDWKTRWANVNLNEETSQLDRAAFVSRQPYVRIYPNPSQNKLTIDFGKHEEDFDVKVLNSDGESLNEWKVSANELYSELNTSTFSPGVYFLQVQSKSASKILKFEVNR